MDDRKYNPKLLNAAAETQLTPLNSPRRVGVLTVTNAGATGNRIRIFNGDVAGADTIFDANPPVVGTYILYAYCQKGIAVKLEGTTSPVATITAT